MTRDTDTVDDRFSRREALKGLSTATAGALALSGVTGATPGKGRGGGPCDIVVPSDYATIQAAVDAAGAGDTVCVENGTYSEQVVVDRTLTLRAADGATPTIEPPSSPEAFTIPESSPDWEPMVFAFGGTEQSGEVTGSGTVHVEVSGFAVDGRDTQPDADRKPAVLFRNASGRITENTIENVGVGGKETFGILAYGDSDVTIADNDVSDYERGGIGANGDGGAHPSPTVTVRDNTLTGSANIGEAWGPNGIQVGFGAAGDVRNNDVVDNRYSDEDPVAAGILVFESDGVSVQGNYVENADIGLSCGSWGWLRQSADNNKFTRNDVNIAEYGVLVEAVADPYGGVLTQRDPSTSNNKVVNNDLLGESDPDGAIGVGVVVDDYVDNDYDPVAENNKLIRNDVSRFETDSVDEGTGTKLKPFNP